MSKKLEYFQLWKCACDNSCVIEYYPSYEKQRIKNIGRGEWTE